jgi:hypothetical protein
MTNRKNRTIGDPELIELFADDPEGLAVVDAIAATQATPQRRPVRRVALIAAVVAAGAILAAVRLADSRAGVIEEALHAVSTSDVVHLTLVDQRVAAQLVDLRTGATKPVHHVIDQWYSVHRGTRRTRDTFLGHVVSDTTARFSGRQDTLALGTFTAAYRAALRTHSAVEVAGPRIGGRAVHWLSLRDSRGVRVRVAVDPRTFLPTFVDYPFDKRSFSVIEAGRAPAKALVIQPVSVPVSSKGIVVAAKTVVPTRSALRVANLPQAIPGLSPARVRTLTIGSGGRLNNATEVVYANAPVGSQLPRAYARAVVSRLPFATLGWMPWYVAPAGELVVIGGSQTHAFLNAHGVFVAIESPLGRVVAAQAAREIAAARSLQR